MKVTTLIKNYLDNPTSFSNLEKEIKEGDYSKIKFPEYETLVNSLFSTNKSSVIRLINSYYSKLVDSNPIQFFHLKVLVNKVTAPCRDMIQNYKYIYMYNRYMDCTELLVNWSPTESYFPLLQYIETSEPDKPIDYTYWLRRFNELPTALKYLRENSISIEFTDAKELKELYRTIPEQYVQDFLDLLGDKSWYMDAIKETDHFLDTIEEWEKE